MTGKNEHVYFIETEHGLVKIGRSRARSARKRPMEIIGGLPMKATLIHIISTNNCAQLERSLHAKYAPYRVRGEWFDLPRDEIQWLVNQDETQYAELNMEMDVEIETARNQSEWVVKRDDEILRLRQAGKSVVEIAGRFLISPQRVYQILEKRQVKAS